MIAECESSSRAQGPFAAVQPGSGLPFGPPRQSHRLPRGGSQFGTSGPQLPVRAETGVWLRPWLASLLLGLLTACGSPTKSGVQQSPAANQQPPLARPEERREVQGGPGGGGPAADEEAPQGGIEWVQDSAAWLKAPSRSDPARRPDLRILYFRTPRELGCRMLEAETFTDKLLLDFLRKHAICRFVVLSRAGEWSRRYEVAESPTLVVLDGEGSFLDAIVGHRDPERLIDSLERLIRSGEDLRKESAELAAELKSAQPPRQRIGLLDRAAQRALERRRHAEAVLWLRELVAIPPLQEDDPRSFSYLYARLAAALAETGDLEGADQAFQQAAKADQLGTYRELQDFERALTWTQAAQYGRAAALWKQFLADHPQAERRGAAAFNQVFCLLQDGQAASARQALGALLADLDRQARGLELKGHQLRQESSDRNLPPTKARQLEEELATAAKGLASAEEARSAARQLLLTLEDPGTGHAGLQASEHERQRLADALADGRDLVRAYSCADCHFFIEPAIQPATMSCVQCHLMLKQMEQDTARHDQFLGRHPHFFRQCRHIQHLLRAPNLYAVGARIRSDWLQGYLDNPYDIRPHLEDSMPQMNLTAQQVGVLIRYFQATARLAGQEPPGTEEIRRELELDRTARQAPALKARLERGRRIFQEQKCFNCHQFGNLRFDERHGIAAWEGGRAEAPNLRFARDRLLRRTAKAWIRDPLSMDPATRMPLHKLKEDELEDLVEFLFLYEPGLPAAQAPAPEPATPAKDRAVTWDEVHAAVFEDTCIHCHQRDRDGGAGNIGAYGFRARRLDLTSYAGLRRGSLQPDGTRMDILKPRPGATVPVLLERLLLRVEENKRDKVGPFADPLTPQASPRQGTVVPGMPLGHPALNAEQLSLLERWIKAGAPGPQPEALRGNEAAREH